MTSANRPEKVRVTSHMIGGSKRSWKKLRRLLTAYRQGHDTTAAAGHAGLHRSTIEGWMRRGDAGEEPYTRLTAAIRQRQGQWEAEAFASVSLSRPRAGVVGGDWRAGAWQLEHSPHTRDRYGPRPEPASDDVALGKLFAALLGARDTDAPARLGVGPRLLDAATEGGRAREGDE